MNIADGRCRPGGPKGPGVRGLRPQAACPGEGQKESDLKIILLGFASVSGPSSIALQTGRSGTAASGLKR